MLIGQKFNKLTVLKEMSSRQVLCQCDCGVRKVLFKSVLSSGKTKSCGCYRKQRMAALPKSGSDNPRWKGGRQQQPDGYVILYSTEHKPSGGHRYVKEHRKVMEQHLGRPLLKTETVHHKNGIRDDNRIDNLELWSKSQPAGQRIEDKLAWCKEFLRIYEPTCLL